MAFELRTFGDIVSAVREELQISASDTTTSNRIKRDINIVYNEIISSANWWWLQEQVELQLSAAYSRGTCFAVTGSSKIIFSEPIGDKKEGYLFSVEGLNEIYRIESHEAGDDFIKLSEKYLGPSNQALSYKIWTDTIPLPSQASNTVEIISNYSTLPLQNLGLQEFRKVAASLPKLNGVPQFYYTSDFTDPTVGSEISSLPDLLFRSSEGTLKTLIFDSSLPASITQGVSLLISKANKPEYNGIVTVSKVSTTNVSNDTLTYTNPTNLQELITPDPDLTIKKNVGTINRARYRTVSLYPSINSNPVTLKVDYNKKVVSLESDSDEPIIPVDDRVVLLYGALRRAWTRARNPEEATNNFNLYQAKLARMMGNIQDSLDKPTLRPSNLYIASKNRSYRSRSFRFDLDGFPGYSSPSGGTVAVLGTPNTVAIFNASGELEGSTSISTTELNYLDGAMSNIQTQIDSINTTLGSAFVTNALVSPSAAIARSKLASGTASAVVVNNGSGVMTDSSITSTELSFLSGVTPLTSVTLNDNVAVATPAITIPLTNSYCFILYSIIRAGTNIEGGCMVLINNGASADLTIIDGNIGSTGITLTTDINGANVRVLYTSTSTGSSATLKYAVIKWAA